MYVTSRSYLTAGVAALGVGAVALTPIQPIPNHVALAPQKVVSTLSVELAAAINPIQPWVDTIKTAATNTGTLFKDWAAGLYVDGVFPYPENLLINGQLGSRTGGYASGDPFPILQQVFANQLSYLKQLPDLGGIIGEMFTNVKDALKSPFQVGETLPGTVLGIPGQYNQNVNGVVFSNPVPGAVINQRTVAALLPVLAPGEWPALKGIVDFTTTPISGLLLGAIGPVLGPVLSLVNSVKAILTAVKAREWANVINETLNIPANMTNAFLNGGPVLDLTNIAKNLLPAAIKTAGVVMGGLLSPGGVAFDGLTAEADATIPGVGTLTLNIPGNKVGPIGAVISLTNYVAKSIKPPQVVEAASTPRRVKAAAAAQADQAPTPKQARAAKKAAAGSASATRTARSAKAAAAR